MNGQMDGWKIDKGINEWMKGYIYIGMDGGDLWLEG